MFHFLRKKSAGNDRIQEICRLAGERAENVYTARGLCCSEAVILVINQAFGGGLSPEIAVRLGSGFCHGMGAAGCTCGALAGAQIILGLFLSPHQPGGLKKKDFEKAVSRAMHDFFRERFQATCCRVLTKRRKEDRENAASCAILTAGGAALAAELLLRSRPELIETADLEYLRTREVKGKKW